MKTKKINKEKINEQKRIWYHKNKEKINIARREYTHQYYIDNIKKIKEYQRKYGKDNREKYAKNSRCWRERNPKKVAMITSVRKGFGFDPLNNYFEGSHFHHTHENNNHSIGIFMPADLHTSIGHSHKDINSMNRINEVAYKWLKQ